MPKASHNRYRRFYGLYTGNVRMCRRMCLRANMLRQCELSVCYVVCTSKGENAHANRLKGWFAGVRIPETQAKRLPQPPADGADTDVHRTSFETQHTTVLRRLPSMLAD